MKQLWRSLLQKTLRDSAKQALDKHIIGFEQSKLFEGEDLSNHFQDVKLDNKALQDVVKSFIIARIKFVIGKLGWKEMKSSNIADFGDSSGIFLKALGKEGTSLNVSSDIIRHLRLKGMRAIKANIDCSLPFDNDRFDYILLFETLEHLPNPIASLREIHRVCRKGLFVSIPHTTKTKVYKFNYSRGEIPLYEHHIFELCDEDFRKVVSHTRFKVQDYEIIKVLGNSSLLSKLVFLYWRLRYDRDTFMGVHKRFGVYYLETGK